MTTKKSKTTMTLAKGLPTALAASLGRMFARHSLLEVRIAQTLYRLAGVNDSIGRVAIASPRGSDALERMLQLAEVQKFNLNPFPWNEFKSTLEDLKKRRDWFGHGVWAYNSVTKQYIIFIASGFKKQPNQPRVNRRIRPEGITITAADLRNLRAEIDKAI